MITATSTRSPTQIETLVINLERFQPDLEISAPAHAPCHCCEKEEEEEEELFTQNRTRARHDS